MEKYKEKVRLRVIYLTWIMLLTCLINIVLLSNRNRLPEISDFILGFQSGVFTGLLFVFIIFIVKYRKSMKSDEALKKLYIEENDERGQLIGYKVSVFTTVAMLILLALSTVVAGFFNELIFFTLLGTLGVFLIIFCAFTVYFKKTL
ncbi:hypothetical protein EJP82_24785 [Paenibacillus anaericanus]|uniref:DUF2178 domain-containing protein n=1 Tax=Paenibacillus anaericanus TaxID=170367 RepID=A0A433XZ97_9BACL|nr:hypothetical protein [Paenibacillus anaericanus]RUT40519.1 hypothetical protein EJP82_24785 [Paenibacillus anaericanus]